MNASPESSARLEIAKAIWVKRQFGGQDINQGYKRQVSPDIKQGNLGIMNFVSHLGHKNRIQPAERQYIPMRHESVWDTCWNTGNQDETGSFGEQASE